MQFFKIIEALLLAFMVAGSATDASMVESVTFWAETITIKILNNNTLGIETANSKEFELRTFTNNDTVVMDSIISSNLLPGQAKTETIQVNKNCSIDYTLWSYGGTAPLWERVVIKNVTMATNKFVPGKIYFNVSVG
jgi:hypothetical protein